MVRRVSVLSLSASLIVLSLNPALAIEPDAAAKALGAALTAGTGGSASFDKASREGSDIVIEGLALTSHDSSDTIRFGRTVIENPTEGSDGVFQSPRIAMESGEISGESKGTLASASMTDTTVLEVKPDDPAGVGRGVLFATAEAVDLKVKPEGKDAEVTVARVTAEAGNYVDNEAQDTRGMVENLTLPAAAFADSPVQPSMLGYGDLVFDVTWDVSRNPETQILSIRDFTLTMQDGGSLEVTGEIGKVPDPMAFRKARKAAVAQMEVQSLKLRYDDASLTGKVLDYQAQKQGIDRAEYAQQISAALPFLLAALNNPEFQNQLAASVGTFLQTPQSLTVRIAPETPVSGAEVMQIAKTAPQTLPDRLKATVTANSAE